MSLKQNNTNHGQPEPKWKSEQSWKIRRGGGEILVPFTPNHNPVVFGLRPRPKSNRITFSSLLYTLDSLLRWQIPQEWAKGEYICKRHLTLVCNLGLRNIQNYNMHNTSYFSVASSALSPADKRTGVECVWKPVMVLGRPAWPTTSTAWPTRTGTERGFRFSSTVISILGCREDAVVSKEKN